MAVRCERLAFPKKYATVLLLCDVCTHTYLQISIVRKMSRMDGETDLTVVPNHPEHALAVYELSLVWRTALRGGETRSRA
jgi:hypothetical protein